MGNVSAAIAGFAGMFFRRGDSGYEEARLAAVWNGRKPNRYPDFILIAANAEDVARGVRFAKDNGLKVGLRSGGHSIVATGIRQGGLLIDLSELTDIEVDAPGKKAWIGPGVRGRQLGLRIAEDGLSFPYGGSPTVGLGGFLLTGGYGLNGKTFGSATSNITAIEVVTADGELIRADEENNPDYLWAARGGGYGYFGVIVRFQLKLYDAPGYLSRAAYVFSADDFETFGPWFFETMPKLDDKLMTLVFGVKHPELMQNVIRITALGFADTEEETRALYRPLEEASIMDRALARVPPGPTTLQEIWDGVDLLYPEGCRYFADTCWLKDPDDAALSAAIAPAFASLPTRYSHVMMNPWIPEERDNAALSGTTRLPFHMYGVCEHPDEDAMIQEWINTHMERVVPFSNGVGKINESNLIIRHQSVLAPANETKLEAMRAKYDSEGRFHSFLREEGMIHVD